MSTPPSKLLTLCLLIEDDRVLLGLKKRGFGEGRWNGFGGKVEAGETVEEAARRELREEAGITVDRMGPAGRLTFTFEGDPVPLDVRVFRAEGRRGEPCESEEMRPEWFPADAPPFDRMWPDDRHWYPLFLEGAPFEGAFHFDGDEIVRKEIVRTPAASR